MNISIVVTVKGNAGEVVKEAFLSLPDTQTGNLTTTGMIAHDVAVLAVTLYQRNVVEDNTVLSPLPEKDPDQD